LPSFQRVGVALASRNSSTLSLLLLLLTCCGYSTIRQLAFMGGWAEGRMFYKHFSRDFGSFYVCFLHSFPWPKLTSTIQTASTSHIFHAVPFWQMLFLLYSHLTSCVHQVLSFLENIFQFLHACNRQVNSIVNNGPPWTSGHHVI
jgi:hypothetical protein